MRAPPVYLDYAATTPLDPRVLEAMLPHFSTEFGNPSSIHRWGQHAEAAVERARETIAAFLHASPSEILFTSGGSESDNLALRGAAFAQRRMRDANHILTTPVEHPAVLRTARSLAGEHGFELELLPVDSTGMVDPQALRRLIRKDTAVVSIIFANNEIGTIQPVAQLGAVCREAGVAFHTDAVQAAAHLPIDVAHLNVDLLALGAHKLYGPKSIGLLFVRDGLSIDPLLTGGGQERGLRAGTHNVPLIVGLAEAMRIVQAERDSHSRAHALLRDALIERVLALVPEARLTGHPTERLPNHASFVFRGVDGNSLLAALDIAGFGCSSGSACRTGDPEPSDVVLALGLPRDWALGSLRVTVGRPTVSADVERLGAALPAIVESLRRPGGSTA